MERQTAKDRDGQRGRWRYRERQIARDRDGQRGREKNRESCKKVKQNI